MNTGTRIVIDVRGKLFFWSLTQHGEMHESARGYVSPEHCLAECLLYQRMLKLNKWREREKAKQAAP